jgi:hypothetical protein
VGLRGNCDSVAWQVTIRNAGKLFHERLALAGHRPGDGLHRGVCGRGRIPCRPRETVGGLFYDQDKIRRHAFVSPADGQAFGKLLGAHAGQIHLDRADEKLSLTDGARWIFKQVVLWLLCLDAVLLDFYHLAEHVHETASRCLGENEAGRAWAAERLHEGRPRRPARP